MGCLDGVVSISKLCFLLNVPNLFSVETVHIYEVVQVFEMHFCIQRIKKKKKKPSTLSHQNKKLSIPCQLSLSSSS